MAIICEFIYFTIRSGVSWWVANHLIMQYQNSNITVSVGVSRIGKMSVVFVRPRAKVSSQYYYCEDLMPGLLPDIRARCDHYKLTLQQDCAPSHNARSTV